MTDILGIDIGGVLAGRVSNRSDTTMFTDKYLNTPEVEGAINAVVRLSREVFHRQVVLISKAGPRTQVRSLEWLHHKNFFERVSIPESALHFTSTRAEKADVARRIGVTHFVDDKCEVLHHMALYVKDLFLFVGKDTDEHEYPAVWKRLHRVYSWKEILAHFGL